MIFDDVNHEILSEELCPRISPDEATDGLEKFFAEADLKHSLKQGGRSGLSKSARAEILGLDPEELELADLVRSRAALGKGCTPPDELAKAVQRDPKLKQAAGTVAHFCRKSLSVTEALQECTDLFSDKATEQELSLLRQATKALDVAAYLETLSWIFARPI